MINLVLINFHPRYIFSMGEEKKKSKQQCFSHTYSDTVWTETEQYLSPVTALLITSLYFHSAGSREQTELINYKLPCKEF